MIPDFRDFQHSNELYHYGMPRRSGRYPWGSGERPFQSREERREIKKENKQKKKLLRQLNNAVTYKEYNMIEKQKYQRYRQEAMNKENPRERILNYYRNMEKLYVNDIEKSIKSFNSTLEKLKEHGVDLDNMEIKRAGKSRRNGDWITYWTGNKYYIKDQK